jgi:hypothetical protein
MVPRTNTATITSGKLYASKLPFLALFVALFLKYDSNSVLSNY